MKFSLYILVGITCVVGQVNPMTIGSDSAVGRFNTQQTLLNGTRVAGFAALQGGFFINGSSVTAQWDTFFPVSGSLDLGAGTLWLTRDLVCANVAALARMGNINGNGYAFDLACSMTSIPDASAIGASCALQQIVTTTNTPAVNSVDWAFDSQLIAFALAGTSNNLIIAKFNGSTITRLSVTSFAQTINTVRWSPTAYQFAVGTVTGGTNNLYTYTVNSGTGALTQQSAVVAAGASGSDVRSIAWRPQANYVAVGTSAGSAKELVVYAINGTAVLGSSVTIGTQANTIPFNQAVDWDMTGSTVALGSIQSASHPTLNVYTFNSGAFTLTNNVTANPGTGTTVSGIAWNKAFPTVLSVCTQSGNPELILYNYNAGGSSLTQFATAAENLNQANMVDWSPNGLCLSIGKQLSASATEFNSYPYSNSPQGLSTAPYTIQTTTTINDVRWSPSGSYAMTGDNSGNVIIYQTLSAAASGGTCFIWSNLCLQLDTNATFENCCITFTGFSAINGNTKTLSLGTGAAFQVGHNSSLLIEDITLNVLSSSQLVMLDNTATISFSNVVLNLDGNFTMSVGHFDVLGNLQITGQGFVFAYQSTQTSRILNGASLILDSGVTFSYDPPIASNGLLQLTSNSSQLALNNATLFATSKGLKLTTGVLQIDGNSTLIGQGTNASQAIQFGDGVSSANDLTIFWWPAANLCLNGYVVDANV